MSNNQLLPSISHELRNYISGIAGLANIISENIVIHKDRLKNIGVDTNDKNFQEISEYVDLLAPYSKEALCYVEEMLDALSVEAKDFVIEKFTDCDVSDIINRLLILNRGLVIRNKVAIETQIEDNLPKIKTDIRRLKQVLINIIINAIKYTPAGKKIKISAALINGNVQIVIADQGIGMSCEEVKMALNGRGQEIDKSTLNKSIDSHGLGMPIIEKLTKLLNIKMKIESQREIGTKVTLVLLPKELS